jgi:hypothetical protein
VPHAEVVGLAPRWLPRHPPLPPVAVAGQGAAARALAAAALPQAAALSLHLDPQADLLVLHLLPGAPAAALPWADGALFLGVDPAAPALLLPTHRRPDLPLALLAAAIAGRAPAGGAPWALLPDRGLCLGLGALAPADPAALAARAGPA